MKKENVLVLGASQEPGRISGTAVARLKSEGYPLIAVGRSGGEIAGIEIRKDLSGIAPGSIDTLTMYLSAANQEKIADEILHLRPRRIIFNPGAENPSLESRANAQGILCENACTLVLLSMGSF